MSNIVRTAALTALVTALAVLAGVLVGGGLVAYLATMGLI